MGEFLRMLEQGASASTPTAQLTPAPPSFARARAVVRHVWVAGPPEDAGPFPGVLIGWERRSDGWWGRVVYTLPGQDATVVVTWVPAVVLQPVPIDS